MSQESKIFNNPQKDTKNNYEKISDTLNEKLDSILASPFHPQDDIEDHLDKLTDKLIYFSDSVMDEYKELNTDLNLNNKNITETEDDATEYFKLPLLEELLDRIDENKSILDSVKLFLSENTEKIDSNVYVPPQKLNEQINNGDGNNEFKKIIENRLSSIIFVLAKQGVELNNDEIEITQGQVDLKMMRQEPYYLIQIDSLNRCILECEEVGNSSFIFDIEKLNELKISPKQASLMQKDELEYLIDNNAGLGVKLEHRGRWLDKLSQHLDTDFSQIEKEDKNNLKSVIFEEEIYPAKIDGDWKNFYIDSDGSHWGSLVGIMNKLRENGYILSYGKLNEYVKKDRLETKKIKLMGGGSGSSTYCYEEAENVLLQKEGVIYSVENAGEWKNFYIDSDNSHWGSLNVTMNKLKENGYTTSEKKLNEYVKKYKLETKKIAARPRKSDAHCYEEVENVLLHEEGMIYLAEKVGEWKNFYIDSDNSHWGSLNVTMNKLKENGYTTSEKKLNEYVKKYKLETKKIAAGKNKPDAYCYEEAENILLQKEGVIYSVENAGEWKNFYIDSDNSHWGSLRIIVNKLKKNGYDISYEKLNEYVKKYKLGTKKIKAWSNRPNAYCYEKVESLIKK